MASPTRWTSVWVSSGSWWWTGKLDVLQSTGPQRVRHNWMTELNWSASYSYHCNIYGLHYVCWADWVRKSKNLGWGIYVFLHEWEKKRQKRRKECHANEENEETVGKEGFSGGIDGKESACNARDLRLNPGLGRSPGGEHGNPLQYSCLENPMDRGAWWATSMHGAAKSQPQLSN